jgi:hypothetical protein
MDGAATYQIATERRPGIDNPPLAILQLLHRHWIHPARRLHLFAALIDDFFLFARELDFPSEELVEEAKVGLDEHCLISSLSYRAGNPTA